MCGPSCPVDPNMDGTTRPHVHPVAKATTSEGFPLHRLPGNVWELPKTLPRALNAFERKFEVTRRDRQSSATTGGPMLDDPELRMYSSGRIHTMRPTDVKPAWQIGRFKGPLNSNEYGLDQPHAIEMDELPRAEPGAYLPKNSRIITNDANGLPVADWRSYRKNKGKMPAAEIRPESAQTVVRHSVAHGPHLRAAQSDAGTALATKASGHVSRPGMRQAGSAPEKFDAGYPRYHARPTEASPLARSSPPPALSRYGASTIVSSCEERPFHSALYGSSPARSASLRPASSRYRARTSLSSAERRPFSRRTTDVSSLRRAASVNAASLRLQAFISAFAPGRRLVVTNPDPDEAEDAEENEIETADEVADEDYTLRHQQRMALNDVKERLELIDKNVQRFKAISYTEPINGQVFIEVDHLLEVKATIDENNRQHGGSQVEEAAWEDFLSLLENAECVIEDEITRILANIETEYAGKVCKAEDGKQQSEQQRKDLRSDTPQDTAQSSGASISTTMAAMTLDSVPPLRTGLARSLSI